MIITITAESYSSSYPIVKGTPSEVREAYPMNHPMQRIITRAIDHGEAEWTYTMFGLSYTTRVTCDFTR